MGVVQSGTTWYEKQIRVCTGSGERDRRATEERRKGGKVTRARKQR